MRDNSPVCADWSDRKLHDAVDAQLVSAMAADGPGVRLGHLSSARALLSILCGRAQAEAMKARD